MVSPGQRTLAFGWWGKFRTKNNSDFLVAGRRLGPFLYTGTMAAVVLGGASTVGGVGLGYKFGISGMWLVVAIGAGVLLRHPDLRHRDARLHADALRHIHRRLRHHLRGALRLGPCPRPRLGGAIVLVYSTIGGMWSITLADQVQFVIKTVGIFLLMLPLTLNAAGGFDGIRARVDASFFQIDGIGIGIGIGIQTIITYFVADRHRLPPLPRARSSRWAP
jgi:SSS family solute:Na+ symporter